MQYLLMIYASEAEHAKLDQAKMYEEYGAFTQGIVKNGNFKGADRLQPVSTATTGRSAYSDSPTSSSTSSTCLVASPREILRCLSG